MSTVSVVSLLSAFAARYVLTPAVESGRASTAARLSSWSTMRNAADPGRSDGSNSSTSEPISPTMPSPLRQVVDAHGVPAHAVVMAAVLPVVQYARSSPSETSEKLNKAQSFVVSHVDVVAIGHTCLITSIAMFHSE